MNFPSHDGAENPWKSANFGENTYNPSRSVNCLGKNHYLSYLRGIRQRLSCDIEKIVKAIKEECKMDLVVEGRVYGFLGISMNKRVGNDGREEIQLLQKGLIDRVIFALDLDKTQMVYALQRVREPCQNMPIVILMIQDLNM